MNTGHAIRSSWISSDDAFLAFDRNHNGRIDDRSELFGGSIGEGFAQLKAFDSNGDGIVNNGDISFSELLLWQDKNSNHQTDGGELVSLQAAGSASLNADYQAIPEIQNGNLLLERSVATWADGLTMDMGRRLLPRRSASDRASQAGGTSFRRGVSEHYDQVRSAG
jgi:serine-aspartate repeat-containing protein C/D/E